MVKCGIPTWLMRANGRMSMMIKRDQIKLNNQGFVTVCLEVNFPMTTSSPKTIEASHAKKR